MTHDKFCDLHDPCVIEVDGVETDTAHLWLVPNEWCLRCDHSCLCHYIAKIRRDERAQAARRVSAALIHHDGYLHNQAVAAVHAQAGTA